ncbi:hypothetical protein [Desulfopila sp. IMCC35008]|uniref:hypothetical protein n=1 Tax=Desulfopila sp. IMCC35008 TaxID=2653858 RepID=UPI0013D2ADC2|nr:hypothetical protein [Desulfopila sp. IMCC35008]
MNTSSTTRSSDISPIDKKSHSPWGLYFTIGGMGVMILLAMGFGFYLGNYMVTKYTPLVDAAMEIKLEATTAHLWLEEMSSGDRYRDIESVHRHLDEAQWYARAMLEGGKNAEGTYTALRNPVLRSEVERVSEKLKVFKEITNKKYNTLEETGGGTFVDQKFDAIFNDFVSQADRVESELQALIDKNMELFRITHIFLIIMSFIFICFVLFRFNRFERRRVSDMNLINNTNKQLRIALNEVKTLQGIIPICSYCKKIRDSEGLWNQLELYIHQHSAAQFSHGICPECYKVQIEEARQDD